MSEIQLSNKEIILRKLLKSDAQRLQMLANDKGVSDNLRDGFPNPYTMKDALDFIEKSSQPALNNLFAIEYKGEYVGNIALIIESDVYRKSAEIGYFIGRPYWNKGIATKSVELITNYGFETLGLARIHTGIFEYNLASMRVLEKNGYIKEGVFRKAVFKNKIFWDEHRYAKINTKNEL